jgi:TonB family protein
MNITRYKWPVIIAAGLHGALFVSFPPDDDLRFPPATTNEKPGLRPIPKEIELEVPVPSEDDPSATSSGGEPVTSLPEAPPPLDLKDPFEVPPVSRAVPEKSALDLKDLRGPIGTGGGPLGPGDIKGPSIFKIGNLDRVPRALARPAPIYPADMRRDGITGDVTIEFVVGTDGSVLSAEAVRWSRREFVEPALSAVRRWHFEPGTVNGRKVRFRMAIPIEFYATN